MPAPYRGRSTSLTVLVQEGVAPLLGIATDRHLLGTLGRTPRARPGVLRIHTSPGDVLAAGRWHLAPPEVAAADAGGAFVRRLSGGRAWPLGEGFLGLSLLLPHRSALVADEPFALTPPQVPNRYVRGLLRALKGLGLAAFYPGRDLVTVNRRPIAALAFETDDEGRLALEMVLAVARPLGTVAQVLERWDAGGAIKVDLPALERGTSLREELGEAPEIRELVGLLREAYAEQFGVATVEEGLTALEEQAIAALAARDGRTWSLARRRRPDLELVGASPIQTGVFEAHFALAQGRFLKEVQLAGDFIADAAGVAGLEHGLRLCPAERTAIERVVETVFGDPSHYVLGIGARRTIAETIVRGLPA